MDDVTLTWNGDRVARDLTRSVGKGVEAACIFLENRWKETLSLQTAPRIWATDEWGIQHLVTTEAVEGAPPRVLSGAYRRSATHEMAPDGLSGRVGTNAVQGETLELGKTIFGRMSFFVPGESFRIGRKKFVQARRVFASKVVVKPHPSLMPTVERFKGELAAIIAHPAQAMTITTGIGGATYDMPDVSTAYGYG